MYIDRPLRCASPFSMSFAAKVNTKPQRIIPAGGVAPATAVTTMQAISTTTPTPTLLNTATAMPLTVPGAYANNGVAKKTTKNHPRIKYSVKHPTAAGQPTTTAQSMASLVSSISTTPLIISQPQPPKTELLNFTLSRKYGKLSTSYTEPAQADPLAIIPPQSTIIKAVTPIGHQIYIQPTPVDSKAAILSNEELQTSIISDLSHYEIDAIELNPYPETTVVDAMVDRSDTHSETMYRMSGGEDSKCSESNEMKFNILNETTEDGSKNFECRHCGKKYRWKSTLRRHENVECGGKEPSYQCPHCPYKAKQRGNLGVHIRKHHGDLPQLESRRKNRQSL